MKKKEHFSSTIERKFVLLRFFIVVIIVVLSVISVQLLQKTANDSTNVINNTIPKLHASQEIYSHVLKSVVYASGILNVKSMSVPDVDDNIEEYSLEFHENIDMALLFVDALTTGTQSQEFKDLNNGSSWQRWKALGFEDTIIIQQPSSDLIAISDDLRSALLKFEMTIDDAIAAHEAYAGEEVSQEEEILEVQMHALELEETAVSTLVGPVTVSLRNMENLLENQVRIGVSDANSDSKTKQILVSLIALLAAIVSLFVGMLFSNRVIVRPLEELTKTAEEMAEGKLSRRVKIHSRDEIGKLGYTFNKMANKLEASYDNLEKIVKEKTDALSSVLEKFEHKNEDLERSQMATLNLLEDLEEEKKAVEQRVKDRTKELEQEKNKLLQVTGNMKGGGILLDKEQNVVFTNDEAYTMLGMKPTDTHENILERFFEHFDTKVIRAYYDECIGGKTFHVSEIDGGHGRVYEIFFHHLKNNNDQTSQTTGYFILFLDISDAKLLERSKSELVAVASHQLRTPLTAMRGNVEMLIDESFGALNKEQHELLDDIDVSTIRLITMVNEMLDITKIEKGDLEMKIEDLNAKELISSVVTDLSVYAQRHEFTIDLEKCDPDVMIKGDKIRVRQVFQNLIDNSIKYSRHPGTLHITSEKGEKEVRISFKDNGIGIPQAEQSKLFERFYRASNTAKTASSGSGLGLYIVKSIIEQLGGRIEVESEEGVGTTFYVTMPINN